MTPAARELDAFERAAVDPAEFDHAAHVRVAWLLLGETGLAGAIARYSDALRRITAKHGVEGKYHETVTWFFLALIAERRDAAAGNDWPSFRRDNPDLFDPAALLRRYYTPERLASPAARRHFLLPDRAGAQLPSTTR